MPAVSVIVPVYKVEDYLRPCVDSILAQSFSDFELILVDDGSPDNCGAICDEYAAKDNRVHVIHQENGGLSAARNAGIDWAFANSDSQWLTFIDSDDCVQPAFLECLVSLAQSSDSDIAVCQMSEFSQDDCPGPEPAVAIGDCFFSGADAALNQYEAHPLVRVSACGKIYQRRLFQEMRYPEGMIHEDQAVTPIVLYQAGKVAISPRKLYCYRNRDESIMHTHFAVKRYDDVVAVERCIAFFQIKNDTLLITAAQKRRDELIAIYSLLARKAGIYRDIPRQYTISRYCALKWMRKNLSDDIYTYQLAKWKPSRLRPHAYWRKIKKTLHIPCN